MDNNKTRRISKFLSLVLRHRPHIIGIELDSAGWVDVGVLLKAIEEGKKIPWHCEGLTKEQLDYVVETNNKKRFAYSKNGEKIRASQGHSVKIDLELQSVEPPEILYHGTVGKFLGGIRSTGLIPKTRTHVHLSKDIETALNVGGRRGKPILLTISAQQMYDDGHDFFLSANGVWLTAKVPTQYIKGV